MSQPKQTIKYLSYHSEQRRNEPGYFLGTHRPGEDFYTCEELLFVSYVDMELLMPIVEKQYPLTDPQTGEVYTAFDHCWDNVIAASVWKEILDEMDQFPPENEAHHVFIQQLTEWIRERLQVADYIVMEGTL